MIMVQIIDAIFSILTFVPPKKVSYTNIKFCFNVKLITCLSPSAL